VRIIVGGIEDRSGVGEKCANPVDHQAVQIADPATASGVRKKNFELAPQAGYNAAAKLFGGGRASLTTRAGKFDAGASGSSETLSMDASFSGKHTWENTWIQTAEWRTGFLYDDAPTGANQLTRARLFAEEFRELAAYHVTVILSGIKRASPEWKTIAEWTEGLSNIRNYYLLDAAIEWAEDQVVYRHGGAIDFFEATELSEQSLLDGLTDEELTDLASLASIRKYQAAEKIIASGDDAGSLFFLRSGVVHVTLPDGIRLATLTAGMPFGEMALLEPRRSADVVADMSATAYEIPLRDFERFRKQHPRAGERIMRNLAQLLADRLILANAKVNLLTSS